MIKAVNCALFADCSLDVSNKNKNKHSTLNIQGE